MVSSYYKLDKMSLGMNNGLIFKKRNAKIDWKKIASIDIEQVAKDIDVYTLQQNIDHLTFCNIESELDTRMMDPNYVKLFKISQLTIEYLMHSQNYLTEVISTVEGDLNKLYLELEELKKNSLKQQKELLEVKKENKKRKKMIETQQTLINANATNSHQCAYCSKVFLNISYLQAHITRRHSDINANIGFKNGLENELEKIKERLRITENDLNFERNARLALNMAPLTNSTPSNNLNDSFVQKKMDEIKNEESKRYKNELKKVKENFKKEIEDLNEKNKNFEKIVKDLQEKLGERSNVGWIKDDVDIQKDTVLKQKQEIEKLNILISDYETQFDDLKKKWKTKEANFKKKFTKELNEKDEEIGLLKEKLNMAQNMIGKTDEELREKLEDMQNKLQEEQKQRYTSEKELEELKSRPPPVTPRQQLQISRSPSPSKQQVEHHQSAPFINTTSSVDIYLPEYCRLTLKAVEKNPNMLAKFREAAIKYFNEELDQLGIDQNDKYLTSVDFKQKMNELKKYRQETSQDLPMFKDIRQVFSEICDKYASQRLNSSLKSTGNRVTFKNDLVSNKNLQHQLKSKLVPSQPQKPKQKTVPNRSVNESEETDDDVSLSNALESEDENDTEPTRSGMNETSQFSQTSQAISPRKSKKQHYNQDEMSDLESISQLLSDRSTLRKKTSNNQSNNSKSPVKGKSNLTVADRKNLIEKKLEQTKNNTKPTPNAAPVGFQTTASRLSSQAKQENSFSSISDLENEATQNQRPKSGFRASLQDSQSSSVWISETNDTLQNNPHLNKANDNERPPTANSLKTSNYDSDEIYNLN